MTNKIWKAFVNYEKEELWVNDMSRKGYHLINYTFLKYTFEYDPNITYYYRIELLSKTPSHEESKNYISFLEETGAKHITSYLSWIYLRRPTSEGDFLLHSDYASKIKHRKTILMLQAPFAVLNLWFGFFNLIFGTSQSSFNLYLSPFSFAVGILLTVLAIKQYKKIKVLEKEQSLRES